MPHFLEFPESQVLLLDGANSGAVVQGESASPAGSSSAPLATRHSPLATSALAREFSSSEYSKAISGIVAGEPPAIDLAGEKRLQDCLVALAAEGAVQSAHDISDGGLAVTLAESCFGSVVAGLQTGSFSAAAHLGAVVTIEDSSLPAESVLFGERGARAVVSASPAKLARVLEIARQYHVAARELGKVIREGSFRIEYRGSAVIESSVEALRDAWAHSLERLVTSS